MAPAWLPLRDRRGTWRNEANVTSRDRSHAAGPRHGDNRETGRAPAPPPAAPVSTPAVLDADAIFAAVGEVPYAWRIDTDALAWGGQCRRRADAARSGGARSGRAFAQLVDPQSGRLARRCRSCASERARCRRRRSLSGAIRAAAAGGATPSCLDRGHRPLVRRPATASPSRAHGVVRVINERHEHEQRLDLSVALRSADRRDEPRRISPRCSKPPSRKRSSCAPPAASCSSPIDDLGRINEAYGFDVADEVIAAVAKRLRAQMRGEDHLGRLSGNKFGIILNNCTPDDMPIAADRLLAGVRDDVVETSAGPVAVTVTIGGVTAPRHARTVDEVLARAQEALDARQGQAARLVPGLSAEPRARGACAARTCARPTRSSPRSTSGASSSPSSRWSRPARAGRPSTNA